MKVNRSSGIIMFLKINRDSVCCCKLMASINLGFASIILLQFSMAFLSISVATKSSCKLNFLK